MSGFEGPILKGMNPFNNNTPGLTASERIRNKRDATIYQAEKQRFQNKRTCGNKNVKYYDNGTIRSMKSYKLQKSLARGNVLCEDCDDKGLLCKGPTNKDALASIQMGNNVVSEYWGGSFFEGDFTQHLTYPVIQSDVSGVWDPSGSATDIPKADLSGAVLSGPPQVSMRYGYINNLVNLPRNLDGSGIVLDPSNVLFPDELCDPFRYLKHSYLKTYLVLTMAVPVTSSSTGDRVQPSSCNDSSYNFVVGNFVVVEGTNGGGSNITVANGVVKSLCCIGTLQLDVSYIVPGSSPPETIDPGIFGLFKVYVNLLSIGDFDLLSMLLNTKPNISGNNLSNWPLPVVDDWVRILIILSISPL
ncbi:MAG: hypothetical protein CXT73_06755 [Methanobacteriota archaeon]|nr:MAG: hypothetical protein CXT73_06755 [Euryarchaeota archaeon]